MSKVETVDTQLDQAENIPFGQVIQHTKQNIDVELDQVKYIPSGQVMKTVKCTKKVKMTKIIDLEEREKYIIKYFRSMNLNNLNFYGIKCSDGVFIEFKQLIKKKYSQEFIQFIRKICTKKNCQKYTMFKNNFS